MEEVCYPSILTFISKYLKILALPVLDSYKYEKSSSETFNQFRKMNNTFETLDSVLSFAGIRIYSASKWNSKLWLMLQIYNLSVASLALIFTTGFVVSNASQLEVLLKGASIWSTCIILSMSLAICLSFRKKFRNYLLEMAFADYMQRMPLVKSILDSNDSNTITTQLRNLVVKSQLDLLKFSRIFVKSYLFCVFLTATLYMCDPIYRMIFRENESDRFFAYDMWFPWSVENFKVYIVTFIYNAHAGYLCCAAYPGLQTTIIFLVGQVVRQIKVLSFILENLNGLTQELTGTKPGDEIWQQCSTNILSQCVKHFVELKSFSNKLNIIFRPFYLTLILDATVLVCMCSVQIAISDFTLETLKFYIHEICFIIMVFIFCYLGQQLQNECNNLQTAVNEKWYIYDLKHKKHLLIVNMALNQGMPVSIFGSITLSLPTFTWFLRTGMSFFTLVMSFFEEKEEN